MKKCPALILALVLALSLAACGKSGDPLGSLSDPIEINVFAAASMTETLNKIKEAYEAENSAIKVVLTLDSSGTLKTQIEEGADCDLFISAAQKQMDALAEEGLVKEATRINLLENKCVLVVPEGNPAGIESFDDLGTDKAALIALGNSDVPVGQYSEEILVNMGLWEGLNAGSKISFGSNVKEVTAQVSSAAADCGIVYGTDAAAAGLEVVAEAPEGSHQPVIYPAAVMAQAVNSSEAEAFLEYLKSDACGKVFLEAGFSLAQ